MAWGFGMTTGWGETEVPMDVSPRRLAPVQHRHLPARGLLSLFSLLRAFLLTVIKRNQNLLSGWPMSTRPPRRGASAAAPLHKHAQFRDTWMDWRASSYKVVERMSALLIGAAGET